MRETSQQRRVLARHGQQRRPHPVRELLKILGIAAAVLLVSGTSVAAYVGTDLASTVAENSVDLGGDRAVPPDISAYEQGFNILLTGLDTCEDAYKHLFPGRCDDDEWDGALNNDVTILVHVSETPHRVTAVSFPRDLQIPIPSCTDADGYEYSAMSKQPISSAYFYGGLPCVAATVTQLTGQDVDFAASVKFGGVIEITNAIGGVDVCLASPMRDEHTLIDWPAGDRTIQGIEALQFLRTRHGVGDGGDLGRIGNQQQYLSSLARKLVGGQVLGNVPVMMRLANAALSNMETSTSLSSNPMLTVQIAAALKDIPFEDIVFLQYPTFVDPENPNHVVPDHDSAAAMWEAIVANRQLTVTYEPTEDDGVVVQPPADGGGEAPADDAIALPDSIRGTSAAVPTCSNARQD